MKNIASVVLTFCNELNVDSDTLLLSRGGKRSVSDARFMILYYLHTECGMSCAVLGRMFGRTRRMVIYSITLTRHRLKNEKALYNTYSSIVSKIKGN
jgi:chromosomal replication initiation ATPase DnaA